MASRGPKPNDDTPAREFAAFQTDGETVIYDTENGHAWVQSTLAVRLCSIQ